MLVGQSGTSVTELVYRHQIKPVIQTRATAMDKLFGKGDEVLSHSVADRTGRSPRQPASSQVRYWSG